MKKFILRIIIFGTALLGLAFVADFIVTAGLMKTGDKRGSGYDEFTTWNAVCSSSIDADVIINGSSRAYRQVNPFVLDTILNVNSYNIGMSGVSFEKVYIRYMTLEKYNRKPKCIIQNIDYSTLYFSESVDDRFLPYLPYIEEKKYLTDATGFKSNFPFYRYYGRYSLIVRGLMEFFHIKHYPDVRKKGFFVTDEKWDDSALNEILQRDSLDAHRQPEAIELFDSYLNHCKSNNIKVIFVFAPIYFKAIEFTKNKSEVMDIYYYFSEKYNIPILDYSTDLINNDTSYFFNANHLNKTGVELFSVKLAYDIDSLGILK